MSSVYCANLNGAGILIPYDVSHVTNCLIILDLLSMPIKKCFIINIHNTFMWSDHLIYDALPKLGQTSDL